jgi:DNA polymerase III alpha subunit
MTKFKNFVDPHVHIQSLDSAASPEDFVKREKELETGYITVTDHGTLQACPTVYNLAQQNGLTPILGVESYVRPDKCSILEAAGVPKIDDSYAHYIKYLHLTMHCKDFAAYKCLIKKLSDADLRAERHGSEYKPIFTWEDVEEIGSYNVTFGSSCLIGMVMRFIMQHRDPIMAEKYYAKLRSLVKPGNFIVEAFPHVADREWVSGVFITINEGDKLTTLKYRVDKNLRTNVGDIYAKDLAHEFKLIGNKHEFLVAIKDYQTWNERVPAKIVSVEHKEEFIINECNEFCPNGDIQWGGNNFVLEMAKKYGDPIVISGDSHFAYPEQHVIQDIRLMSSGGNWRMATSYHRRSSDEAYGYFKKKFDISEAEFEHWIENSHEWAGGFKEFKFEYKPSLPSKFYPDDTIGYLGSLIKKHGRMDWKNPAMISRLKEEVSLFSKNGKMDFLPYFFAAEDARSAYAESGKLAGPARGSAGGVLLSYLIGVTDLNPLPYNLSLNRFMTPDRIASGALPDIDMDFGDRAFLVDEKDGWMTKRFGDHFAQISTVNTSRIRSSIRDVHRALYKRVPDDVEVLCKQINTAPQGRNDLEFIYGYDDNGDWTPGSIESDIALQTYIKKYTKEWELVRQLLGQIRSRGRHASAYALANAPLDTIVPMGTVSGVRVTSLTAPDVEAAGVIKLDILGVNTLNDIEDAIRLIQAKSGLEIPDSMTIDGKLVPKVRLIPIDGKFYDIWELPSDQVVYDNIACGRTETVFQFNQEAAIQGLEYFNASRPNGAKLIGSIEDMAIFTAINRPGPLDAYVTLPSGKKHNMMVEYTYRARGMERSNDVPKILDDLLPETYGILVYQEQVEFIYKEITGSSGAEAEEFRRNVAKKKADKIMRAFPRFIEGVKGKYGAEGEALGKRVWELIETFSNYGFNKSHAVAYCLIAYACAYLKHHFKLQWWCAVLKNASKEKVNENFWRFCHSFVEMPNISRSGVNYEVHGDIIQAPITLLKGVGEKAHIELCAGMPYTNIDDFCNKIEQHRIDTSYELNGKRRKGRSALTRGAIYKLIVSGTMDDLFPKGVIIGDQSFPVSVYDQLRWFEEAFARSRKERKPKAVDTAYSKISRLSRYQLRKSIIPAYGSPVLPILADMNITGLVNTGSYYLWRGKHFVASLKDLERIDDLFALPDGGITVAVPAYIEAVRPFRYGEKRQFEAMEIIYEVEGVQRQAVKWGRARKRSFQRK